MNFQKNSLFFLYSILFAILFPSTGLTKNFSSGETSLIKNEDKDDKYHLSAKIIPRQTMFRLEKSSPLTWSNDVQPPSSNWTVKDNNYNWNPDNDETFINIPIQNNFTQENKTPTNLHEIQIDYQDFFPKNPSQFSLEMTVLEKDTSTFLKNPPKWKKKTVTAMSSQLFPPKLKEDLFFRPIKKNTLYLIRRELGLPFDLTWRYSQGKTTAKNNEHQTLFQRRFHMNLSSVEFIDIIFSDDFSEKDIKNFHCNFRITDTKFYKTSTIRKKVLRLGGEKSIRFYVGEYVRNIYKVKKDIFLEEMIIFLPGLANKLILQQPIQSINFYENKQITQLIPGDSLDVSSAKWIKRNIFHLFKQEIGLPTPSNWRYYQDDDFSVFERTLHKDLHEVNSIDFILNKKVPTSDKIFCKLRVGFTKRPFASKTIDCENLSKEIIKTEGQRFLRIKLHDLVNQFYAQGKKKVFLEELKFYLAGPVNYYIKNQLLQTVRFFKIDKTSTHEICFYSSKPCSRTEFLSPTHKRYIVDMSLMNELIDKDAKLLNLNLKIKAQNLKSTSKFKLIKARAIFRNTNNKLLSITRKDLAKKWERYFSDLSNSTDFFKKLPMEDLSPIFLNNLSDNKIDHIDNWWDLGVKSIDPKFNLEKKLNLPSSSYLWPHIFFLEKIKPSTSLPYLNFLGQRPSNLNKPAIRIGVWWRLSIIFLAIMILGWASNTNKGRDFLHKFFPIKLITFSFLRIEKYPYLYFLLAAIFYILGLLLVLRPYQNHLYTMGSIIFSLVSYNFAKLNYGKIVHLLPWSRGQFFIQKELLLGSLFLFFLATAVLLKMANFDRVAEQTVSIGFIMLFTLIFQRLLNSSKETNDLNISNDNKHLATRVSNS